MQASVEKETQSIHDIMEQLSRHLMSCHTGTFLIATNDNHSCRMSLTAGRVTHCSFGRTHGDEALQKITKISAGNCSFVKNARYPFKERSEVKKKHGVDQLIATLNQSSHGKSESSRKHKLPSGLTDRQMEVLFGKFHFE
ncbi:hypothetical protein [Leucothrix arctica]|nr:hypothetical protein [Leucothrix arctica]